MRERPMQDIQLLLRSYRLTTAEILYHFPDHPALLQSFIWQELDIAPKYPILTKFLDFWNRELDGKLHSVKIMQAELVTPAAFKHLHIPITVH